MNKKLFCLIMVITIFMTSFSNAFGQSNGDIRISSMKQYHEESIIDQNVIDLLESKKIEYIINEGNRIQLKYPKLEVISELNSELISNFNTDNRNTLTNEYPTEFYHIKTWDRSTSKLFIKSTKAAFTSAIFSWIFGWAKSATELSKLAAAGFGLYYFQEMDEENIYFSTRHYYQILGPGYFDSLGNHIGDYRMKRVDRTTKSSNHTGGDSITQYQKSTQLVAIP